MGAVPERHKPNLRELAPLLERQAEWLSTWQRLYEAELSGANAASSTELQTAFARELERLGEGEVRSSATALQAAFEATATCLERRGVALSELLAASGLMVRAAIELTNGSLAPEALAAIMELESSRVASYVTSYGGFDAAPSGPRCTEPLITLRRAPRETKKTWGIVGKSREVTEMRAAIATAAQGPKNVLVTGESGSGKELVARAIHEAAGGERSRFVAVNCAALPSHLVESELFGHVRGAFTGASGEYAGLFRAASGGTLFLDELTEMSPEVQAKLLRALEERAVRPVGGLKEFAVDVRVVASTNRDPAAAISAGKLRPDLYYRLQSYTIHVPPLRERREDIPVLAEHFLASFCHRRCGCIWGISQRAMEVLTAADWPGNVRELRNAVEHAVSTGESGLIQVADLPAYLRQSDSLAEERTIGAEAGDLPTLSESEEQLIRTTLEHCRGNKLRAAQSLGISRHKLYDRLKKLGVR